MREPLLGDELCPRGLPSLGTPPGSVEASKFKRRQFLQALGVVGVGLVLAPRIISAKTLNAGLWRDRVTGFVYTVCHERRAQVISARLISATLEYAPPARTFHTYFAAPFIFVDTRISNEEVLCGNGFEVNLFPLYDVQCPCGGGNDLNSPEIKRITNRKEIDYYRCVPAPAGPRRPLERSDHARYAQTMKLYPYNHSDFTPQYTRDFQAGDKSVPGFYVTHNNQVGPGGKPVGDMLLGEMETRG